MSVVKGFGVGSKEFKGRNNDSINQRVLLLHG